MGKRNARDYEYVCRCRAYKYPHRFGSGKCKGIHLVEEQWETWYGAGECEHCSSCNRTDGAPYCEILEGIEQVDLCPIWQEFVHSNEIRIYEDKDKFSDVYNERLF